MLIESPPVCGHLEVENLRFTDLFDEQLSEFPMFALAVIVALPVLGPEMAKIEASPKSTARNVVPAVDILPVMPFSAGIALDPPLSFAFRCGR